MNFSHILRNNSNSPLNQENRHETVLLCFVYFSVYLVDSFRQIWRIDHRVWIFIFFPASFSGSVSAYNTDGERQ